MATSEIYPNPSDHDQANSEIAAFRQRAQIILDEYLDIVQALHLLEDQPHAGEADNRTPIERAEDLARQLTRPGDAKPRIYTPHERNFLRIVLGFPESRTVSAAQLRQVGAALFHAHPEEHEAEPVYPEVRDAASNVVRILRSQAQSGRNLKTD